jgi:hypothetical protein
MNLQEKIKLLHDNLIKNIIEKKKLDKKKKEDELKKKEDKHKFELEKMSKIIKELNDRIIKEFSKHKKQHFDELTIIINAVEEHLKKQENRINNNQKRLKFKPKVLSKPENDDTIDLNDFNYNDDDQEYSKQKQNQEDIVNIIKEIDTGTTTEIKDSGEITTIINSVETHIKTEEQRELKEREEQSQEITNIINSVETHIKTEEQREQKTEQTAQQKAEEITGIIKAIDTPPSITESTTTPEEPDEITDMIKAIETPPSTSESTQKPDEPEEITDMIKAIETPPSTTETTPTSDEHDEITGIIKAIETPPSTSESTTTPEEPEEITGIIKAIDPPLPPSGSMSPSSGSTVGNTDEIINIINAIESYIKKEQPITNESEELFSIINAVETHIQLQSKIGKIIDIINKINEIENKDQEQDQEPNSETNSEQYRDRDREQEQEQEQDQDQALIEIIKEIYMGKTPEIIIDVNTLYEDITILSHALIAMNTAMIEILLNKGANINAGTPKFLEILEFYAIIYKKQPLYKGPIDKQTQEIINQLQNENDLLKQRIDELTAQLAIEKDPIKKQEINKTIDGLTQKTTNNNNEINEKAASNGKPQAETKDETTKIESKTCSDTDPNIVKLGTINNTSEICYDIEKQQFV